MAEADYSDILTKSWDEIPEPKTLPNGSYRLKGRNASFLPAKDDNSNPRILFFYSVKEPMDDVDQDALDALGPDYDMEENDVVATFWLQKSKDYANVKAHLKLHGVDVSGNIQDSLKAFKGSEVNAFLTSETFTNAQGQLVEQNKPTAFTAV